MTKIEIGVKQWMNVHNDKIDYFKKNVPNIQDF